MTSADWEQDFEAAIALERTLVIELLDASRAISGMLKPAGGSEADASAYFAEKFSAWRAAVDEVSRLGERILDRR